MRPSLARPTAAVTRVASVAIGLAALSLLVTLAFWLRPGHRPLPIEGAVPAFTMTTHTGHVLSAADLVGQIWIAAFVFTRCPDVCPALTNRMGKLHRQLSDAHDPVRLVSFSVDPTHDTPEVLRTFAARFRTGPSWDFVTGTRPELTHLVRDGFHLAFADDGPPEAPITHSDRLVLVDRQLRIRGYYHGTDGDDFARLLHDARALRAESAS